MSITTAAPPLGRNRAMSAEERKVELWLVCTNRQVLRPLEIAGLTSLFRIAGTVDETVSA